MPDTFAESQDGTLLVFNGIDLPLRWDGKGDMTPAGIDAPTATPFLFFTGAGTITGTYYAYLRFVDSSGNFSNLSPVSLAATATSNSTVTYTTLATSDNPRVVRRQVLRNTAGQTTTFYVDIDTFDMASTTLASTKTDTELSASTAVALLDAAGKPLANRFDPPPSDRKFVAAHLDRMFAAGFETYAEGSAQATYGSAAVHGIGTEWPATFAGRFLYLAGAAKPYQILSASGTDMVLTETYLGPTVPYAEYAVRPAPATRNLMYYSESGLPEAWPPINAVSITDDGDEITGMMNMSSFLYILKRKRIYRFSAQSDPINDGFVFLSAGRGCVNNRSWVVVGNQAFLLDESGVYRFTGSGVEDLSRPIAGIFAGEDATYRINWSAARFFHAVHDEIRNTVRFFVALAGDYLPQHCLALDHLEGSWWVERYTRWVGSSYRGREGRFTETWRTQRGERTYLGTTAKRVVSLAASPLDGIDPEKGESRGGVASATNFGITLAFDPHPQSVGTSLCVVSGKGKGQTRICESVSGRTLRISRPWGDKPDATSVVQIGGVGYTYRSGKFQFAGVDTRNPRTIRSTYRPSSVAGDTFDLRIYLDWSLTPVNWHTRMNTNETYGIKYTQGSPDAVFDLAKAFGQTALRFDGNRDQNIDSPVCATFELAGFASASPASFRQFVFEGVAGGVESDE